MVSHPQPPDQQYRALTHRAPSVASSSRTFTNRRHRSSRSHSGGASYRPQNEFPNFAQTGDVEITINAEGQERKYVLHRLILSQCSGFFEASTSEEWTKAQQHSTTPGQGIGLGRIGEDDDDSRTPTRPPLAGPREGEKFRWFYELDWGNQDEEIPMLVQKVKLEDVAHEANTDLCSDLNQHSLAVGILHSLRLYRTSLPHLLLAFFAQRPIFPPSSPRLTLPNPAPKAPQMVTPRGTMIIYSVSSIIIRLISTQSVSLRHIYNANLFLL